LTELLAEDDVEVPFAFTAAIVNVYEVPATNVPVTLNGEEVPDTEREILGLLVAVYEVIAEPPVAPAVNGIETVVLLVTVTVPIVGACGTVVAVIELDALDTGEVPVEFVAVAVNVYEVALCNPVTVTGLVAEVAVKPPGDDVAVYEVGAPPVAAAVTATVAEPLL